MINGATCQVLICHIEKCSTWIWKLTDDVGYDNNNEGECNVFPGLGRHSFPFPFRLSQYTN